jgi:hypothetical protein
MIRQTAGAELCAAHDFARPNAIDCVKAYDQTYKGRVNLSKEVVVGDPTQTSMLQWRVPYDVHDAAGNKAETVWRDVVVEEVDLSDVEAKVRRESSRNKDAEIRSAVEKELAAERRKKITKTIDCPTCPACKCPGDGSKSTFDPSMCNSICEAREQTCQAEEMSSAVKLVSWLESLMPAPLVTAIVAACSFYVVYLVLRVLWSLQFTSPRYAPVYDAEERERGLRNHITEFSPQPSQNGGVRTQPPSEPRAFAGGLTVHAPQGPPVASASLYGDAGPVFTPTPRSWSQSGGFQSASSNGPAQQQSVDIYERSPIITPSKRGDGVRQRSPYRR